jgi:hypothetical protein
MMSLLNKLNSRFRIGTSEPAASESDLQELKQFSQIELLVNGVGAEVV